MKCFKVRVFQAPSSLLDALEQHLASLEGKKGSAANTPTQTARYANFNFYRQLRIHVNVQSRTETTNFEEYFAIPERIRLLRKVKGKMRSYS